MWTWLIVKRIIYNVWGIFGWVSSWTDVRLTHWLQKFVLVWPCQVNDSTVSPVHILMLSIQAVCGLPHLRAPGIVPCIISFSRQLPCFLMVWPQYASFLALTVSYMFPLYSSFVKNPVICFRCCPQKCRIFLSTFISDVSRRVPSVFLSVQLSQPYVAMGHTSNFIRRIFVEIDMLWLFHIFCSDAPNSYPLVGNTIVNSPSSVIRDLRYGNVSTCSSCSFWMSMQHDMPSLAIILVLSTLISRLNLWLTRSRRSTSSCSSAYEVANRMMSSA